MKAFPEAVQDEIGTALGIAQFGGNTRRALCLGEAKDVFEVVEDHRGDTYQVVCTGRFEGVVYVLHGFQKKSPNRHPRVKRDVDLIA